MRRFLAWISLVLAVATLLLAAFIVVPAPTMRLLPLAVGAPEVSAWLVVGGVSAMLLSLPALRRGWMPRAASIVGLVAAALASTPLLRFAAVADAADESLRVAFGGRYLETIPATVRERFRPQPLVVRDLFRGLPKSSSTNAPALRIERHRPFAVVDNDTLVMNVYAPTDSLPHPTVVQVYGGGWANGDPDGYREFAEYLAHQGYVVCAIDYRHAPHAQFPSQVNDVRLALAYIGAHASEWSADTSRLALIGRSAGAHLAMLAAYAPDAPTVRAVIDLYGPVDLIEGYRHPPRPDPYQVRHVEEQFLGGTPDAMEARYRAASPIGLVTRKLPPTLLIYGGRDHIVEPRFGTLLAGRLHAEGGTVVHVEIPWAEHAFDAVPQGPSSQLARYLIERFLAATLLTP